MRRYFFFHIIFLMLFGVAHAEDNYSILNQWIEIGPNGKTIARVITKESACPTIIVDQTKILAMSVRAVKSKDYAVTVCEAIVPFDAKSLKIDKQFLALPKKNPQRIVVIGDAGCRIKSGAPAQACNDPNKWPFAKIAAQASKFKPDLIIHVGDYHYREAPCPIYAEGCANSPHGYNWSVWQADFFSPAKNLLTAAPWIFVRGNHEDCLRAWEGWSRFLDPFKYTQTCQKHSALYSVPLKNLTLFVLDSSSASDFTMPKKQVAVFAKEFREISASKTKNVWLLTHKPVWVIAEGKQEIKPYSTLQKAIENNLPSQLNLILSGHVHLFQILNFNNGRPAQIISGNSGTSLSTEFAETLLQGLIVANTKVHQEAVLDQFGFLTLEKINGNWRVQEHDVDGKVVANCKFQQKHIICMPV